MNKFQLLFLVLVICFKSAKSSQRQVNPNKVLNLLYEQHVMYRSWHQVDPLQIDPEIEIYAQNYSEYLAANRKNKVVHSHGPYGENILRSGTNIAEKLGSYYWYNEVKKLNFSKPEYNGGVGHFTQLVWKDTKKIGCGVSQSGGDVFTVCNYSPRGNFKSTLALKTNVLPRRKDSE
uniref:SCP domain-containing protein n=1 Tax=Parastrongyloides trichosuri TaxID=131310 RepID=A0A0N4ZV26_PARTI